MLCISSHLSVQGYDSSSANINWREFFRRENKLFSTGGLPTEETMTRSAKAMTGATNFVAMFNFSTSVTKFTLVATILFFVEWDICRMKFDRNFPEKDNLTCFGLGLSLRNENKLWHWEDNIYLGVSFYWRYLGLKLALQLLICKSVTRFETNQT